MGKRSIGERVRLSRPVSEQQEASDGPRAMKDDNDPKKSRQTI